MMLYDTLVQKRPSANIERFVFRTDILPDTRVNQIYVLAANGRMWTRGIDVD